MGYGQRDESSDEARYWMRIGLRASAVLVAIIAAGMAGCPQYDVWRQGLVGQAELRRAEQNRKIAVQEAEAKREASHLLAEAEVERAKGVAAANQIIGDSLKGNEAYLRYLWVQGMQTSAWALAGRRVAKAWGGEGSIFSFMMPGDERAIERAINGATARQDAAKPPPQRV